jgi:hypothetical protein
MLRRVREHEADDTEAPLTRHHSPDDEGTNNQSEERLQGSDESNRKGAS